ncbi:hypothetical protein AWE51_16190 [Aquimarina aggregata]|uniref:Uncharacterized protein n=1 Tax=Aquimarina aggregata TaxID=1642818 RepID=A0A163D0I4_9FLAO|nr:hypothetical protein [Aquimarina aggregata]KZS42904.1 hypothetical protein AWE51_16190 [Aquimarina aggregata]
MRTPINLKKYFFVFLASFIFYACEHDATLEEQSPVTQELTDQNKASVSALYANFVTVLRDIEDPDIMSYSEFEKSLRNTNDRERALLEEEIKEGLRGIDPKTNFEDDYAKAGSNCKSNVVSRLTHSRIKALGRSRARMSWSKKARQKYGWKYRKWSKAKDKGYYFYTDGTDYLLWKYRAYGKPCK